MGLHWPAVSNESQAREIAVFQAEYFKCQSYSNRFHLINNKHSMLKNTHCRRCWWSTKARTHQTTMSALQWLMDTSPNHYAHQTWILPLQRHDRWKLTKYNANGKCQPRSKQCHLSLNPKSHTAHHRTLECIDPSPKAEIDSRCTSSKNSNIFEEHSQTK